jgi:hypothetical protein
MVYVWGDGSPSVNHMTTVLGFNTCEISPDPIPVHYGVNYIGTYIRNCEIRLERRYS